MTEKGITFIYTFNGETYKETNKGLYKKTLSGRWKRIK